MLKYKKRINFSYLAFANPTEVYKWLENRFKNTVSCQNVRWYQCFSENEEENYACVYEYLLLKRQNSLINLALAMFGASKHSLRKVFTNGNTGVRCAALQNPAIGWFNGPTNEQGWLRELDFYNVLEKGTFSEIEALATNKYHKIIFFEEIFKRKGRLRYLPNDRYEYFIKSVLWHNPLLKQSHSDVPLAERFDLNRIFSYAWELTRSLEPSETNADILFDFLRKSPVVFKPHDINSISSRWSLNKTNKESDKSGCKESILPSEKLCAFLTDNRDSDNFLVNSEDCYMVQFFYRRFSPKIYPYWESFLKESSFDIFEAILENENIWMDEESRDKLVSIAKYLSINQNQTIDPINKLNDAASLMKVRLGISIDLL